MTEAASTLVGNFEASQDMGWAASFLALEEFEREAVLDRDGSFGERLAALVEAFGLPYDLVVAFGSVPSS